MFALYGEGIRYGCLAVHIDHIVSYSGLKYEQQIKAILSIRVICYCDNKFIYAFNNDFHMFSLLIIAIGS